jgi:hypothetical protein
MKTIRYRDTQNDDRMIEVRIGTDPVYRSMDGIKTHPFWSQVSLASRRFLSHYLTSRDKIAAAHTSGKMKDDKSAATMANRYLADWRVRYLIAEYRGQPMPEAMTPIDRRELSFLLSQRMRTGEASDQRESH